MDDVEKIYLDDLDKPVRNAVEEEAYRSGAPVEMTPDAVLAAAVERTGLADFGPNDFRERLAVWMQAADEDTGLAISGRQQVWDQAVLYAANRLQLEDLIRRQPEILDIKIDRPIMIAGLPRSGTTHLVNMLAADPRLRSSQLWEMCFPFPLPCEKPGPIEQSPSFRDDEGKCGRTTMWFCPIWRRSTRCIPTMSTRTSSFRAWISVPTSSNGAPGCRDGATTTSPMIRRRTTPMRRK
ncbi:MAG: sulfotransferase [Sphingomonadales bacterium]|nr:sulfotransferase [Sphingomonadales bacterium]